jgi:hypothetical protein
MLLVLRHQYPALFADPETIVMQTDESDWEEGRRVMLLNGEISIILVGNFTDKEIQTNIEFPLTGFWNDYFSMAEYVIDITSENKTRTVSISPHSFCLYVKKAGGSANENTGTDTDGHIFQQGNRLLVASKHEIEQISIYSFNGKLHKTVRNGYDGALSMMDLSGVEKGVYLVTARILSGKVYSRKIYVR